MLPVYRNQCVPNFNEKQKVARVQRRFDFLIPNEKMLLLIECMQYSLKLPRASRDIQKFQTSRGLGMYFSNIGHSLNSTLKSTPPPMLQSPTHVLQPNNTTIINRRGD